jgi:hypothetical protein
MANINEFVKPLYDESIGDFIESATAEEIEIARPTQPPAKSRLTYEQMDDALTYLLGSK